MPYFGYSRYPMKFRIRLIIRFVSLAFCSPSGNWVVTLFRSGIQGRCQESDPGPGMLAEPERHSRSARLIALTLRRHRQTQCSMGTDPVVLKELQVDEGIPTRVTFGKGMGLTGQSIEPIAQSAVDPLNMSSCRCGGHLAQGGTDLDREQLAMLITMLDSLRQAHVCRYHQPGTSALARADRLTIGSAEDRLISPPAIAAPDQ